MKSGVDYWKTSNFIPVKTFIRHMKYHLSALLFFCFSLSFSQGTNIISLRNGSGFVKTPPSYVENTERVLHAPYSPGALFDDTSYPWCSKENASFPMTFVMELVEEYTINELRFDNHCENYAGIEANQVEVYFSTTSPNSAFAKAGTYVIPAGKTTSFKVNGNARWIKLVILSNHGMSNYTELGEFMAFGEPAQKTASGINIDGTWKTNWQNVYLTQSGNTFTGHYTYSNIKGTITNGTINRNTLEFDWDEGKLKGTALLYMNAEGNRISGYWQNENNINDFGLWTMYRTLAKPIEYDVPHIVEAITPAQEIPQSSFNDIFEGKEVVLNENIVLQNVLFVRSRADLLPDSYPELDKLIVTLKANPKLKIELSGHTDNGGSRQSNIDLSERRVETVKKYLQAKDIQADRISGNGYGPDKPIADNSKEETRRLNRRVEFRLFN